MFQELLKSGREFFKEIFLCEDRIFTLNVIVMHGALILLSFLFIYLFSYSTSFRYPFFGGDSAVFQTVGKYWSEGVIPYKELFEHKGPLLFLIDAVGYAIYPRVGIMIPQTIFMYISLLLIWKMTGLYFSFRAKIFCLVLTLIYFVSHYESGNLAGEYSVVFLSAAAYCFMKFLKSSSHDPLYGFIYGLGFGACVLLRATNAMPICCFAFLSMVLLIQSKEFKNLRKNFLSFCTGFVIICLPFVIYFAAHDALYDMIYGTILLNVKYAVNASFHNDDKTYFSFIFVTLNFFPLFLMILASVFEILVDRKNKIAWCGLFSGIMLLIMLMRLRHYFHYSMIIVPVLPLLFVLLRNALKNFIRSVKEIWRIPGFSFKRTLCKFFLPIFVVSMTAYSALFFYFQLNACTYAFSSKIIENEANYIKESADIQDLQKIIPENERASFVTWGLSGYISRWILETGIKPRNRFFFNQKAFGMLDPNVRKEWFDGVTSNYPLWILYGGKLKVESLFIFIKLEDSEVENLLAEKYILKGEIPLEAQTLKLYRLKE